MKKRLDVYIDYDIAATITIEIKDDYVEDIGTCKDIADKIQELISSTIQKTSIERNFQ
jgi:predicted N-formylglutamate amidohydrolase